MKKIDYLILVIFSVIILVASIITILLSVGLLDVTFIGDFLEKAITGSKTCNIITISSAVLTILAAKGIFFTNFGDKEKNSKDSGILLENGNGKLMISKATLENLVNSTAKEFESAEDIKTVIQFDENNNLSVLVNIVVTKDVIIKDLTLNLQNKIKEVIKKTSDLEVKEVNVKIRNISAENKQSKKDRED